nr:DNA-processing protein DprA [Candidatus Woesebacteria bacterium]
FSLCPGIGPVKFDGLLAHFGSVEKAYNSSVEELAQGLGSRLAGEFELFRERFQYDVVCEELAADAITFISRENVLFPPQLLAISDPPIGLYVKGDITTYQWDDFFFAVVGTRNPTEYGKQITKKFSSELAQAGAIIVSGLAMGVDALAHWESVKLHKKTVAFLGCGVNIIYPSVNRELYFKILENGGLIISEFPPNKRTIKGHFIARNRLISALSKGVLVAEGLIDSGSLITARYALAQGKDVFAPPSPITSELSKAPNLLIKEGAKMVTDVNDILEEYQVEVRQKKGSDLGATLSSEERSVYQILAHEAFTPDELARTIHVPIFQLLPLLSSMELSGIIEKNASGKYQIRVA